MNITFSEKVRNIVAAGAVGAAIYNFADSVAYTTWTLIRPDCGPDGCVPYADDVNFNWPVVVAMPTDEGKHLRPYADANTTITIGTWDDDYTKLSGTSMAAPHVSGVAALLWCLAPNARATDIRNAISLSAEDILTPGVDIHSGWGIIDALAAAKLLNPGAFGISPTTPVPGPHRRSTRP
jgi:subtilisin family serine protease